MKAVSELKATDYSKEPELNRIYQRLSNGRKQFAEILEKNINAVMQISSLDLGYTGTAVKHFDPDFVRMCTGRKIHD